MEKKKFQTQKKILYTKQDNVSKYEYNSDNPRDVLFMALIQDENSRGGKSSTKRDPTSTSKMTKKWTYNGIHLPSPKPEEKKSSSAKEPIKMEKVVEKKYSSDGITPPLSKSKMKEKISSVEEISRS